MADTHNSAISRAGLLAGPVVAVIVTLLIPLGYTDSGGVHQELSLAARAVAGVASLMAVWWLTEAISIYATALVPLCLFPILGIADIRITASSYGHEIIFLFMGGFVLALAIERWGLHKRLALNVLAAVGPRPGAVVGAFMAVAAFMSMWVTNTATTLMLLPVAISVIALLPGPDGEGESSNFTLCLLLGIAYAASLGGMGTIIGTAPNAFAVSFIKEELGRDISFIGWMIFAVPLVCVFVPIVWLVLTRWVYPMRLTKLEGTRKLLQQRKAELTKLSRGELLTLLVFLFTALAWITRPLLNELRIGSMQPLAGLSDAGIAIICAMVLFVTPVRFRRAEFLMDWATAVRLPWGMLILFGGGLSLAAAMVDTGFNIYLGSLLAGFGSWPSWMIVSLLVAIIVFLTEMVSNTATTATLVPVVLAVALGANLPPLLLVLPATLAASCAFMLPVATPPNAIVFGSGLLRIAQMSRAGIVLNLMAIVLITVAAYVILIPLLGIEL
ncbi:MAG: DASS family sodium-coupled anion symporter [Gammaproteobacteria bacterium]|nr:DASS family sodium-coupled anion symporter [Gammaproteobacteria bacterium]MDP6694307.1 DASS family sodium-coupled anion symporter [Gammaproteobacteria bacterium]